MTDLAVQMTEVEARTATESIRSALDRVSTAWATLAGLITDAYQRRADLALGYGSWAEYAEAELKPAEGLAVEVRRQLVGMLSQAGMSTRAIAPTVGVSQRQISTDVRSNFSPANGRLDRQVSDRLTPTPEPNSGEPKQSSERLDRETGELKPETLDEFRGRVLREAERTGTTIPLTGPGSVATPRTTGLDGKSYPKPVERKQQPTRRPITEAFWDVLYDLNKKAEALQRLVEDDRFDRNGDALAARNLPQMRQTASTVSAVLAALENHGS